MRKTLALALALGLMHGAVVRVAPAQRTVETTASYPPPVYRPPVEAGAPKGRVGGGSRSASDAPVLEALAPDHTGLTLDASPTLYWYASLPAGTRVEITVLDRDGFTPLLETRTRPLPGPGIHGLDLAEHGVALAPGVDHQWFVTAAAAPAQAAHDPVSGGVIRRVSLRPGLRDALAGSSGVVRGSLLAQAGIWYDAVDALRPSPGDPGRRSARAALLEQVGLAAAAAFDRGTR